MKKIFFISKALLLFLLIGLVSCQEKMNTNDGQPEFSKNENQKTTERKSNFIRTLLDKRYFNISDFKERNIERPNCLEYVTLENCDGYDVKDVISYPRFCTAIEVFYHLEICSITDENENTTWSLVVSNLTFDLSKKCPSMAEWIDNLPDEGYQSTYEGIVIVLSEKIEELLKQKFIEDSNEAGWVEIIYIKESCYQWCRNLNNEGNPSVEQSFCGSACCIRKTSYYYDRGIYQTEEDSHYEHFGSCVGAPTCISENPCYNECGISGQ